MSSPMDNDKAGNSSKGEHLVDKTSADITKVTDSSMNPVADKAGTF